MLTLEQITDMDAKETQAALAMLQLNWDALTKEAQEERTYLRDRLNRHLNEKLSEERGLIPYPEVFKLNRFELSQGVQKSTVPCLSCHPLNPVPAVHLFAGMTPMCASCYDGVGKEGR